MIHRIVRPGRATIKLECAICKKQDTFTQTWLESSHYSIEENYAFPELAMQLCLRSAVESGWIIVDIQLSNEITRIINRAQISEVVFCPQCRQRIYNNGISDSISELSKENTNDAE